mmetsp:Transcript_24273/g.78311  ORF Transcript_24273/g.78311 Transcript_24273/m.78311 type:complete len:394 (+) Transcript_24273:3-1184(+)
MFFGTPQGADEPDSHPLEAGAMTGILSCSLAVNDSQEVKNLIKSLCSMRLEMHGIEVAYITNDFWGPDDTRDTRDICLGCVLSIEPDVRVIAEVHLILFRYERLRWHREVLNDCDHGRYFFANSVVRAMCKKFQMKASSQNVITRAMLGGLKRRFGVLSALTMALNSPLTIWCWQQVTDNEFTQPPEKADMQNNKSKVNQLWVEVRRGDREDDQDELAINALFAEKDRLIPKGDLVQLVCLGSDEQPSDQGVLRLMSELLACEARLLRDPSGTVFRVSDFVVLRIYSPDGANILVRESRPAGLPTMTRRGNETLEAAASRAVQSQLPSFLRSQLEVQEFDLSDGVWVVPDSGEDAINMGSIIPTAKRYFVMKVNFIEKADPFLLLRATLGLMA